MEEPKLVDDDDANWVLGDAEVAATSDLIDMPDIEVPQVDVPQVELPQVDMPDVSLPSVDLGSVDMPSVGLDAIDVPSVDVPSVDVDSAVSAVVSEPAGWAVSPEAAVSPEVEVPAYSYEPTVATPEVQPEPTVVSPIVEPAPYVYEPEPAPVASVPAGWYADPAGRFELRYWDGLTWTEHVARAGQQYTDPPVA